MGLGLPALVLEGEVVERVVQLARHVHQVVEQERVGVAAGHLGDGVHDHLVVVLGGLPFEEREQLEEGLLRYGAGAGEGAGEGEGEGEGEDEG